MGSRPQSPDIEPFVVAIVLGGTGVVAGLWLVTLAPSQSPAWLAGVVLAGLAAVALGGGVVSELDWSHQD